MKVENSQHNSYHDLKIQWKKIQNKSHQSNSPKPRFKHLAFIHSNILYIYGGAFVSHQYQHVQDPDDIYLFDLMNHELGWQKRKIKCSFKSLKNLSGQCGAINGNHFYMFGGVNAEFKCNNYLVKLHIESLELESVESKGEIPQPRESAHMFCIGKEWLLLYGGVNTNSIDIYGNFHFYNIQQKTWSLCSGSAEQLIYPRYDPSLTLFNNKIYLFGGLYRNNRQQQIYLNDLYQITAIPQNEQAGSISIKRLQSQIVPQARSGHSIIGLHKNYLLVMGGQNSSLNHAEIVKNEKINIVENTWIFDLSKEIWIKLNLNTKSAFNFTTQFSLTSYSNDKIYQFGGLNSQIQAPSHVVQLFAPQNQLAKIKNPNKCDNCEMKFKYNLKPTLFPSQFIQDIAQSVQFPFAAFGLLADNAINNSSTFLHISYRQSVSNQLKYVRFVDNAKLAWTNQELVATMKYFSSQSTQLPAGSDKKSKTTLYRQRLRRQYGTNIKIASLRLGSGFLHISHSQNGEFVRVFLMRKQNKEEQDYYTLKYYIADSQTKAVVDPQMQPVSSQINSNYGYFIKQALGLQPYKNILFIFDPKIQDFKNKSEIHELKASQKHYDIFNGTIKNFTQLQEMGYNITDCVDVSLRAYLVSLYIKNQNMKISLAIKNLQPIIISTQLYLQRVDKLCKQKCVFQVNNLIDYDFKIVQMYYLFDISKKMNFFSNGLLLYQRNRLITRFKYPLGQLVQRKIYKAQGNVNFIRLFGFIELPDHIPVNAFKTGFTYSIMMNKLFSRIKLISKMLKRQVQKAASQGLKRLSPSMLSAEEARQDEDDNPNFGSNNDKSKASISKDRNEEQVKVNAIQQNGVSNDDIEQKL